MKRKIDEPKVFSDIPKGAHERKFRKVLGEYSKGTLHSGSKKGPKVSNPKQALAIAFSESQRDVRGMRPKWDKKKKVL